MTHTSIDLPESLYYADLLDGGEWINYATRAEAAAELRRLHAAHSQYIDSINKINARMADIAIAAQAKQGG